MTLPNLSTYKYDASILMVRKNRPSLNKLCMESLFALLPSSTSVEVIVLDDSTDAETPMVMKKYMDVIPIKFFHFSNWNTIPEVYVNPLGRVETAMHINFGAEVSEGRVLIIEVAEIYHTEHFLNDMIHPHINQTCAFINGKIKDYDPEESRWGADRFSTGDPTDGFLCMSILSSNFRRFGGAQETFMSGLGCWDEEITRRFERGGLIPIQSEQVVGGHYLHADETNGSGHPSVYRALLRNRVLKDAGYSQYDIRSKYCRPGSEMFLLHADSKIGRISPTLCVWDIETTLENLL